MQGPGDAHMQSSAGAVPVPALCSTSLTTSPPIAHSTLPQTSSASTSNYDPEKESPVCPAPLALQPTESRAPTLHPDLDLTATTTTIFPEGGLRAWLSVFGSFAGMTAAFGLVNTIGTLQAWLAEHQLKSYSPGAVGWIFSVWTFLVFFAGLQVGPIFDAYGTRWLVGAGSLLLVAACLALGWCTAYWHFMLTIGVLFGLGGSLIFTPAIASVGHFFLQRRGNATGLAATGGSIGGIIFPLMLQKSLPELGFAWSTRLLALIVLVLLLLANALMRTRPELRKRGQSTMPSIAPFRDPTFALTTAGVFFVEWGLFIPISYITSCALSAGVETSLAYQLLAILNAGSFFGRWLPGIAADHVGRFNAMIITVIMCIVAIFALWLPAGNSVGMLVAFTLFFGFASGSNICLTPVCVGQLCKTRDYGRYYAACYSVVSLGTLTGIPIAGQLITADNGGYRGLILFTGGCYIAGLIAFTWARVRVAGWAWNGIY
ncbi:MAG: hypothetical protein M1814_005323 [Vezdaea aestivalis]|nr:MAG: hypothetical protein M1814_005323 [Vezdaea aestivalis]